MPQTKPARDAEGSTSSNPNPNARAASSYALPASIAFGSVVIAFGLYAGLGKGRAPAADGAATLAAPSAPTPTTPSTTGGEPSARVPAFRAAPSELAISEVRRRVTGDARALLEKERAQLTATCWAKAAAAKAEPATASFVYSIAFGADGREMGRAVSEAKTGERPEVADCLRITVTPMTIAPAGQPVMVKVTLALP